MKEAAPILKHCATWLLSAASQRNIDAQTWSVAGLALSTIVPKFPVLHIKQGVNWWQLLPDIAVRRKKQLSKCCQCCISLSQQLGLL